MKYILLVAMCFLLSGCFIRTVYVPVPSCPYGEIPKKSELKTKSVTEQSEPKEILRALVYDVVYLNSYSDQLIILLEGYNLNSSGPPNLNK